MSKKAVCLLSGGLDSAVTVAMAKAQGFDLYAISFDYGQRHSIELSSAKKVAEAIGVKGHLTASVDLGAIGGSALTDNIAVPKGAPDQTPSSTKNPGDICPGAEHGLLVFGFGIRRNSGDGGYLYRGQRARLFWLPRLSPRIY